MLNLQHFFVNKITTIKNNIMSLNNAADVLKTPLSKKGHMTHFAPHITRKLGLRSHHSTETTLIKLFNDLHINTDSGKLSDPSTKCCI